jgi:glucosamine-6-phosphate deaminase
MHENFFRHVNAKPENVHIPDGTVSENYDRYCFAYEQAIRDAGGIDLQILGIGRNGHIGFNEPTSSLGSRTRIKVLTKETIDDNRKSFQPGEKVPECAVTMGIGTILEARRILLLASGSSKATSIAQAIEGPVTASVTASALQHHPDVTFIVDQEAGANLKHHDYYARVLRLTAELTPERI